MSVQPSNRAYFSLMGALVADAAALGFHWLYDQQRIRRVAPHSPEFHGINQQDYADVAGYFAHSARRRGDLSQYGEQLLTLMQSLSDCNGDLSLSHYEQTFKEHFGYGGRYVGYIDRPTRDTLDNISRQETALLDKANALAFKGTAQQRNAITSKVKSYAQSLSGDALRQRVTSVVSPSPDQPDAIDYALALCELIEQAGHANGADDQQLPAISKLPALSAVLAHQDSYLDSVESAVRVTNNNDLAVHYAKATAVLLKSGLDGHAVEEAIAHCRATADSAILSRFDQLDDAQDASVVDAIKHFGMACDLDYAFPSILHVLKNSNSYTQAIQENIYAGGDSCGRAIIIGAVMGAVHGDDVSRGIPTDWINTVTNSDSLQTLSRALASFS